MDDYFIRVRGVSKLLGIGISTIWAKVKADKSFPQPYKISPRVTVWRRAEVENWMNQQCKKEVSNETF